MRVMRVGIADKLINRIMSLLPWLETTSTFKVIGKNQEKYGQIKG